MGPVASVPKQPDSFPQMKIFIHQANMEEQ